MSLDQNYNPCTIGLDIFYNILRSMNSVRKAVKIIKSCDREDELIKDDIIIRLFNNYYREDIISLDYRDMVNLFANNRKILFPLFNDNLFWVEKIKYDMKGSYDMRGSNDINKFFTISCLKYPLYVQFILNNWDVDIKYDENSPLINAIIGGNILIIKLLLDKGVNPEEYSDNIMEDIMDDFMEDGGDAQTLKFLIDDGRFIIPKEMIVSASSYGNYDMVKIILEKTDIDPAYNDNDSIRSASYNGHYNVVKLLLSDKRVDPSANYNRAIQNASQHGHHKIVELLLKDPRVDPSSRFEPDLETNEIYIGNFLYKGTNYAIRVASLRGYDKVVKVLLSDKRVDPTVLNNEAIRSAALQGHIKVINILLNDKRVLKSIDINTILNYSQNDIKTIVMKILKRRADIDKIYKIITNKKLFEYWEDSIGRSEDDELNAENISQKFKVKRENNIINVSAKLEEFSSMYEQQIRGYLLVNKKEMIVIFQSFPKFDVSIVHVKI